MSTTDPDRMLHVDALVHGTRRLGSAVASFADGVAARTGLARADIQTLVSLAEAGPLPSWRIAELSGLSAGATTRMIDRLEQAGYVRRTADPADRRIVRVELVPERAALIAGQFDALADRLGEAAAGLTDRQLSDLGDYFERAVAAIEAERAKLREHVAGGSPDGSSFSAPVGGIALGRLVFLSAVANMEIRGDGSLRDLYRASFSGPIPRVRVRAGTVSVRYARFAWFDWRARIGDQMIDTSVHWRADRGEIALNASLPWTVELRGGASRVGGDLSAIELRGFELAGGASRVDLIVGRPGGVVPIVLAGSMNELAITRPAGVAVRLRISGGSGRVEVDGQVIEGSGGNLALNSDGAAVAGDRYDVDVRGSAHRVFVGRDVSGR